MTEQPRLCDACTRNAPCAVTPAQDCHSVRDAWQEGYEEGRKRGMRLNRSILHLANVAVTNAGGLENWRKMFEVFTIAADSGRERKLLKNMLAARKGHEKNVVAIAGVGLALIGAIMEEESMKNG